MDLGNATAYHITGRRVSLLDGRPAMPTVRRFLIIGIALVLIGAITGDALALEE